MGARLGPGWIPPRRSHQLPLLAARGLDRTPGLALLLFLLAALPSLFLFLLLLLPRPALRQWMR